MRILTGIFILLFAKTIFAQDTIRFRNGEIRAAKVSEVSQDEVKYHRYDNLSGPLYTNNKSEILTVKYFNGHVDTFKVQTKPGGIVTASPKAIPVYQTTKPIQNVNGRLYDIYHHNIGDRELLYLIKSHPDKVLSEDLLQRFNQMKAYKNNQVTFGFVGLGIGVASLIVGYTGAVTNTQGFNEFYWIFGGVGVGLTGLIGGQVASGVFRSKRYAKLREITDLYNFSAR
jgi:hypothetical protein